jgi:hypothetical protein
MYSEGSLYGNLGDGGYKATHKGLPRHLAQRVTPNFEKKEGERFGNYRPAPYLPSVRTEEHNWDQFVIAAGSPVALDSRGFGVPAGYKLVLAGGAGQGPQYSQADAIAGVKNAAGVPVTPGEFVVNSMIAQSIKVGNCLGVASYDVFMQLNSDPHNPASYQYHNYNRQTGFSILTNYLLEFPIEPLKRLAHTQVIVATAGQTAFTVAHAPLSNHIAILNGKDRVVDFTVAGSVVTLAAGVAAGAEITISFLYESAAYGTPFPGMTTFRGDAKFEGLVTFNAESKFVMYTAPNLDEATLASLAASVEAALDSQHNIVGVITNVDKVWPKQLLDQVVTAYDERLYSPIINPETGLFTDGSGLDKMPGSANGGVPHMIQYAGGDNKTGVVTFKLKL